MDHLHQSRSQCRRQERCAGVTMDAGVKNVPQCTFWLHTLCYVLHDSASVAPCATMHVGVNNVARFGVTMYVDVKNKLYDVITKCRRQKRCRESAARRNIVRTSWRQGEDRVTSTVRALERRSELLMINALHSVRSLSLDGAHETDMGIRECVNVQFSSKIPLTKSFSSTD